ARRTGRISIGRALPLANEIIAALKKVKGVVAAEPAGSLRRMRSTVGDLDILVAAKDSAAVMEAFVKLPRVTRVLGKGEFKSSIEFTDGIRAQVWVHPPNEFGTALQYATGSKDHNVLLRQLALDKGLSLSDHSFKKVKGGKEIFCSTEEEVYKTLGLQWIPPELREGRDEVALAKANKLPKLIEVKDIKANLHMHSTYSDGKLSMLDMAKAAIKRGLKVIVFSDHSVSLGVANGLSIERHKQQAAEIKKIQKQLGDKITILHSSEVEIKADGSLDYPDDFLASLDLVVASLHSSLRQPREKITERLLKAVNNPHVDIIGHPTGREIPDREGADLDMEVILQAAAKSGVAMEISASPYRLDLDDPHARRARELGVLLSINTDAHSEEDYDTLHYGVAIARRAGVLKEDVINCWSTDKLLKWLKGRK
ncbi:MAG TPA: PHP domain-containing protein, partial [Anaerolineales bacterium]|nr:PHP domain-containing protein [Anaerolineales bacterium]